jgi:hypothetical protein
MSFGPGRAHKPICLYGLCPLGGCAVFTLWVPVRGKVRDFRPLPNPLPNLSLLEPLFLFPPGEKEKRLGLALWLARLAKGRTLAR